MVFKALLLVTLCGIAFNAMSAEGSGSGSQAYYLMDIYDALNFTANECGTSAEFQYCNSTCTGCSNGVVKALYLGNPGISGYLSNSVYYLSHLTGLFLGGSDITGSLSSDIYYLDKLEYIGLHGCPFTGTIPSEIGYTNVHAMNLEYTFIGGAVPNSYSHEIAECYLPRSVMCAEPDAPLCRNIFPKMLPYCSSSPSPTPTSSITVSTTTSISISGTPAPSSTPSQTPSPSSCSDSVRYNSLLSVFNALSFPGNECGDNVTFANCQSSCTGCDGYCLTSLIIRDVNVAGTIDLALYDNTDLLQVEFKNTLISGTISPLINNLSKLTSWIINGANLGGVLPATMPDSLVHLQVSRSDISGPIPSGVIGPNLEKLFLYVNSLVGTLPVEIYDVVNLQFGQNAISGVLPVPSGPSALEVLNLFKNDITGTIAAAIFANLPDVVSLNLARNEIEGTLPDTIQHMESLNTLNLDQTSLVGKVPNVDVTELSIATCTFPVGITCYEVPNELCATITGGGLPQCATPTPSPTISVTPSVTMSISPSISWSASPSVSADPSATPSNSVDPSATPSMSAYPSMTPLSSPSGCPDTGDLLTDVYEGFSFPDSECGTSESFAACASTCTKCDGQCLTALRITDEDVGGTIDDSLFDNVELVSILLKNTLISGTLSHLISKLTKLTSLVINGSNLSGTLPATMPASIEYLQVSRSSLVGSVPDSYTSLPALTSLYLYVNSLAGVLPSGILTPTLVNLYLGTNDISGPLPEVASHKPIKNLNILSNELTGTLPSSYSLLSDLDTLILGNNNDLSGTIPASYGSLNLAALRLDLTSVSGNVPAGGGSVSCSLPLSIGCALEPFFCSDFSTPCA